MKKYIFVVIILFLSLSRSYAQEKAKDINKLFYTANAFYEKEDYAKAVEGYINILDMGFESGNIYYNIGNGFLKLGRLGYAILCYEKASRFIPGDSDLKSNLDYARSLIEEPTFQSQPKNLIIRIIERPFEDLNLDAVAISATILYVIVILASSLFLINPIFARKGKIFLILFSGTLLLNLSAFALRYYDEETLRHGTVIQKEVECKYEPIDRATTYYKLHEGNEVLVLETRNGWRQIKRLDGKIAWTKKEAVEEL